MGLTCSCASDCEEDPVPPHTRAVRSTPTAAASASASLPALSARAAHSSSAAPPSSVPSCRVRMGASPSSALAVSSIIRQRQAAAAVPSLDASSSASAAASSPPAFSLLTPTRAAVESLESLIVVDLREVAHKGDSFAGTNTKRLQLFPSSLESGPDPLSSRSSPSPPHPLVHPPSASARYSSEVEFVRSMISELLVGSGEWELQSLHRLFNADWIAQFQSHQKALAPMLFKSAAEGGGSLFKPHLHSSHSVLMHLLKFANDSPVGVPVFAWHGTKNEATLPSILKLGLSTAFSVRGGRNIFVSQEFAHSVSYCLSELKHLFLCLVLRTEDEIRMHASSGYSQRAIHAMAIPEQARVLPVYMLSVKFKPAGNSFVQ